MIPHTLPVVCRAALVAAITSLTLLVPASDARACACCAEHGERVEAVTALSLYDKGELGRLRFAKAAKLYTTVAGLDVVKGIHDPSSAYAVGVTRQGDVWTFTFTDGRGNAGTLAFTLPSKIESFFVDPRDSTQSSGHDPVLYKEWRLSAPAAGTGIFKAGMAGNPTARLVLHGRGNVCTDADQFTAWTLVVSGPNADYMLLGALSKAASTP